MNFDKLEKIMELNGIVSLAEIARNLNTTPQAVSNWKARNQVPNHVILEVNEKFNLNKGINYNKQQILNPDYNTKEKDQISIPDLLVIFADQLKVILIVPFIFVFFTLINIKFIQIPMYSSTATLVIPEKQTGSMGGFAGIASQFGVNIQSGAQADLSSPDILPKLIYSKTFADKILYKRFYTDKYDKELPLISIISDSDQDVDLNDLAFISKGSKSFRKMVNFEDSNKDPISSITITASEPLLAQKLAETVLEELEKLNRYYKSKVVSEKIKFIDERISSVTNQLTASEKRLKNFNEQNRQISSPALQLEQDRLLRDVEVQKGIYLTLKQQLELAKIEEIQQASIFQILDEPRVPQAPISDRMILKVILAGILGFVFAVLIAFARTFLKNAGIKERKKIRKIRNLLNKKINDLFKDPQVSGIMAFALIVGLPYFLQHKSKNPTFFGLYSGTALLINIIYILFILILILMFFYNRRIINKN